MTVGAQDGNLPAPVSVEALYLAALLEEIRALRAELSAPVPASPAPAVKKKS